ncbi:MAG: putative Ig domain-containing protein [Bradymonadales bacterium]|nr:putative Ig domain-containing protein [Bradymonadales bacterium]
MRKCMQQLVLALLLCSAASCDYSNDPGPRSRQPIDCETFPEGAVGATYTFTPEVAGSTANDYLWTATNLPPGLSMDADTGTISGVPTVAMTSHDITISLVDLDTSETLEETLCGELVINESLNADAVMTEPNHCLDISASYDDLVALLQGGDGTEITCSPLPSESDDPTCPLGVGNGRLAPGVTFDATSCTHSGSITSDRRGTWVWMVEVTQSDYTTSVPFCATNDVDTFFDITVTAHGDLQSDLAPNLFEYDASSDLSFGYGSHQWEITWPDTPDIDLNVWGYRYQETCSPFLREPPWEIDMPFVSWTEVSIIHQLSASGPAPGPPYDRRPFVTSFDVFYCMSDNYNFCDVSYTDQFEQNAQTSYHFTLIGYPTRVLAPGDEQE